MSRLILIFAILTLIFLSSSQTYEQQSLIPILKDWFPNKPFESVLSMLQIPYWGTFVSVDERGYYHFIEFLIRKGAHVVSFGLLSLAFYWALPLKSYKAITAFVLTVLYAVFDEYHQSLTGGRTPYIGDIFLDGAGAAISLSLAVLLKKRAVST